MKKFFLIAMAAIATLTACNNAAEQTEDIYRTNTYMYGRTDLFNVLPVAENDIVMVGDDYTDLGEWASFYGSNTIKNRGIRGDKASAVINRIDSVAAKKPAKLFLSEGYNDIKDGAKAGDVVKNLEKVMARIHKISPKTELYFINIANSCGLTEEQKAEAAEVNAQMDKVKKNFTCIDLAGALEQGLADGTFSGCNGLYLNGAGYEAYAKLLAPYVGMEALNSAVEEDNTEVDAYLQGWYGKNEPGTCMPAEYYSHKLSVFRSLPDTHNGIVLLGDSLTDFANWDELFPGFNIVNRGIAGDMIDGITCRLDELEADQPNKIYVMAGCNDLGKYPEKDILDVWSSYEKLIKAIHAKFPKATLYIQSILPVSPADGEGYKEFNKKAENLNKILLAGKKEMNYIFVDLTEPLKDEYEDLREECTTDGCHLTATGYLTWATELLQIGRLIVIGDPYTLTTK